MAASLGVAGRASSLLEPRNEGLNGEGLGEPSAAGRGRAGDRSSLSSGRGSSRSRGSGGGEGRSSRGGGGSAVAGGGRSGRRARAGAAGPESRARDLVVNADAVDVEDDAVLVCGVEASSDDTLRGLSSSSSNFNVEALRVVLGAVGGASTVESDDLVAEDVLASGKRLRDCDGPCVVLGDHLDSSPLAIGVAIGLDLGPLEGALVNSGDITSVGSDIGDDRTHVGRWPVAPVEFDGASGSDLGHGVAGKLGGTGLVADDVGLAEGVGLDKTVVEVLGVPADVLRGRLAVLVGVVVVERETLLVLAVDGDTGDNAVGKSASGEGGNGSELGEHVERLVDVRSSKRGLRES
jgi:hypothetical protein